MALISTERVTWLRGSPTRSKCRRIATRYEKLAANYFAVIKLGFIHMWLRAYKIHAC